MGAERSTDSASRRTASIAAGDAATNERKRDLRFLLSLAAPYRGALLIALLLLLAESLAALVMPLLAGKFSEALLQGRSISNLLLAWMALIAVQCVLSYGNAVMIELTGSRLIADACSRVYDHLQALPLDWHHARRRGDVLSLLTDDVVRLSGFLTGVITPLLPLLLTCAGALVMMMRIQPWIGLLIALLVPVFYIALQLIGRKLRPLSSELMQAYATKSAIAEQNLSMLPIIKAYTGEASESALFGKHTMHLRDLEVRLTRLQALIGPGVRLVASAGIIGLLWVGSHAVASGEMKASDLVSLLLYGLLLTQPVSQLASVYGQTQTARGSAQRLIGVFSEAPEPDDGSLELERARGELDFVGIRFGYAGREIVLRGLDLHVAAGDTVAITGLNGAGKSTLAHLLLRFADPDAGSIRIDGIDLRELRLRNLRSHIALVSQNVLLFNASVRENIAYGRSDASREDIERSAIAARAHDFVTRLPNGYDTVVGDQGIRLSGGQKQRIALARALLKDPAVLILDEATAMFDPDGEREFIAECHELLRHRTVLLITHRPASLALADRVLRLENGVLQVVKTAATNGVPSTT